MASGSHMKVTYLYHSGFAVELDNFLLVFDYIKAKEQGFGGDCAPDFLGSKQLLVFASHKHPDHFQLSAFAWAENISKNTCYFVGNDIKLNEKYLERKGISPDILKRLNRMAGGSVYKSPDESFRVEALRSTDQGAAFLVTVGDKCIYHAGDLNYWYWEEEPKEWNEKMERDYKGEIDKIAGRHIDIAFVPLDPRLQKGYGLGMDYFLQKVHAEKIFPMHMWGEYEVIERYKQTETGSRFAGKIADVSEENAEFFIDMLSPPVSLIKG